MSTRRALKKRVSDIFHRSSSEEPSFSAEGLDMAKDPSTTNGDSRGSSASGPPASLKSIPKANGVDKEVREQVDHDLSTGSISAMMKSNVPELPKHNVYVVSNATRKSGDKLRGSIGADEEDSSECTVEEFLEFIANDRLRRLPHKGSQWDTILKWAEYFAIQVYMYHKSVEPFVSKSQEAAQLDWASCRMLLKVGGSLVACTKSF